MIAALLALVALLGIGLLAGCQSRAAVNREGHTGSGSASPVAGVQQITITTGADYRFHPSTITVHPGKVRIILVNTGGAPHNWQLTGFPAAAVPLTPGGTQQEVEFTAPTPGHYRFVCSIHIQQGQIGTMIVQP